MRLFIEVAREGNLAAAARKLGLSAPSGSRLLGDLEKWLGQPLVRRTTRHTSLTELGERYLPQCIEIVGNTEALKRNVSKLTDHPTGRLRVTVSGIVARRVVAPIVPQFLAENPSVSLELDTTDKAVDIMSEKIDIAIRVGHLEDSSLVARKLCDTRLVLVATQEFLDRNGTPSNFEELRDLPCLIDTVPRYGAHWPFLRGKMVTGPAKISDGEIIRDLTLKGLGVSYLPDLFVEDDLKAKRLIELFPDHAAETLGIYAVFPPREFISSAARAFAQSIAASYV
jgi:DNA-binding transcriptional LysR family regulator